MWSILIKLFLFTCTALGAPSVRWADDPSDDLPEGFVTTKGTEFWLDHGPFYFSGANCYWLPQLVHDYQYQEVFDLMQSIGIKVIRTWAFSMLIDEVPTDNLTYYQVSFYWLITRLLKELCFSRNGSTVQACELQHVSRSLTSAYSLNYGPSGLQRLDTTVQYAEKYDMKL